MRTRITAALAAVPVQLARALSPAAAHLALHLAARSSDTGEIAGLAAAAAALVGVAVLLSWRVFAQRHGQAKGPQAASTAAALEAQADHALVETDDSIKTSDQELGFAVARFGEHAAAPFSAALNSARGELAEAFRLRQRLDAEAHPAESGQRKTLAEIQRRCGEANRLLDEQSAAFDRLQDLEVRAPEVLSEVDHYVTQQAARLRTSEEVLARLAERYTANAVAIVTSSPDQADERLEFARAGLSDARQALSSDETALATVFLRAAEAAADQAESLLGAIEHLEAELTQAASALPAALRELDVEIAESTALVKPADRAAVISRSEATAAAVRDQMQKGAPFDALSALRQLEEADTALDNTLASARTERDRQDRAAAVLDQVMLVARSAITAAEDFITTRRGGVGAIARTRLAEARRHFQQAIASGPGNPESAVSQAQDAAALAQQARVLAEQDVAQFRWSYQGQPVSSGGTGAFGSSFDGAVLGGILIDSPLGEGRDGFGGGGFRLGGFGTPASFGGTGTRGRHSIAGLF